jgi:hypothetical protein
MSVARCVPDLSLDQYATLTLGRGLMALKDHLTKDALVGESRCSIHRLRSTMTADDRKTMDAAVAQIREIKDSGAVVNKYTENASWLIRGLEAEGFKVSMSALHKHIRRDCGCNY